jgi:hypothetical protein
MDILKSRFLPGRISLAALFAIALFGIVKAVAPLPAQWDAERARMRQIRADAIRHSQWHFTGAPETPRSPDEFRPDEIFYRPLDLVTNPPTVPASDAAATVDDAEQVLGVVVAGVARAYPLNQLFGPESEVVNDTVGEKPIVISFCPIAQSGVGFDRKVGEKVLQFRATGTWKRVLLIGDAETETLWSPMFGKAMRGLLKGSSLAPIPVMKTDWQHWREAHPKTTVMTRPRVVDVYRTNELDNGARFVLGLAHGDRPRALPFDELVKHPVVNATVDGRPIVVLFDRTSWTATFYDRRLGDRELEFRLDGNTLMDKGTQSAWNMATGRATSGPLAGATLQPVTATVASADSWNAYFPRTITWAAGVEWR